MNIYVCSSVAMRDIGRGINMKHFADIVIAHSSQEATGIMTELCKSKYPARDGYYNHDSSASLLSEKSLENIGLQRKGR